jgi:hypothetical protein
MGAGRMVMTQWLTGIMWWHFGYQPRHRSTRQTAADPDWLAADGWYEPDSAEADPAETEPAETDPESDANLDTQPNLEPQLSSQSEREPQSQADDSRPASQGGPDLHEHLTNDQLRHLLEGCALDDMARIVRPLVQVIAHSSHSATTLASTWGEFRKSTRDAYALHVGDRRWSDFFRREELGSYPAEDAVELKLRQADHAWRLLTDGVS